MIVLYGCMLWIVIAWLYGAAFKLERQFRLLFKQDLCYTLSDELSVVSFIL